jgi:hypothetical protein
MTPDATPPPRDPKYPTRAYRIILPDGRDFVEEGIGPSQIVAHWPELVMLQRVDGGFW